MSKFFDKLEKVGQATVQPMGFGVPKIQTPQPSLLVVAALSKASVDAVKLAIDKGADALIFKVENTVDSIKLEAAIAAADKIPYGLSVAALDEDALKKIEDMGADFVVFQAKDSAGDVLNNEKVGKALEIEPSMDDDLLEAVCDLPIDAVLLQNNVESSLTVLQLLDYQRLVNLVGKPVIIAALPGLKSASLELLRDIGVAAIQVDDTARDFGERIESLKKAIISLPSPSKKKRTKMDVFLPMTSAQSSDFDEDEDDDGDE